MRDSSHILSFQEDFSGLDILNILSEFQVFLLINHLSFRQVLFPFDAVRFGFIVEELLRNILAVLVVANHHLFIEIGDLAFECDVGSRQSIITCDHHTGNVCLLKVLNCIVSFLLELVLEYLKPIEL